jgi:hypothetical protein
VSQHALPPIIYAIDTNLNVKMERWYQRYGHLNYEDVKRAQSIINGMDLLPADLQWKLISMCQPCEEGKLVKRIPRNPQSRANQLLKRLYTDYWGSYHIEGLEGKWYFILTIDDYSRYKWVETVSGRSSEILV